LRGQVLFFARSNPQLYKRLLTALARGASVVGKNILLAMTYYQYRKLFDKRNL
jgi:hypothetical protein